MIDRLIRFMPAALAVWVVLWAVIYRDMPPSPDDGLVDYMGWMLLHGGVQYVDFIDMNWPGAVWLHALSTWLFGVSLRSWRMLDFLVMLAALGAGAAAFGRAYGRGTKLWLWFLYPALYTSLGVWMAGTRDAVAGHIAAGAIALHALAWERQHLRFQIAAGAAIAAAILVKPTLGFMAPLLAVHGLFASLRGAGVGRAITHAIVLGGAAAGGLAAALAVQLLLGAPLEAIVEGAYLLNRLGHHIVRVEARSIERGVVDVFVRWLHWVSLLGAIGFVKLWLEPGRSVANRTLALLPIAAGAVSYAFQAKFFQYHAMPMLFGVVALASALLATLGDWTSAKHRAKRAVAFLGIALAIAGTGVKTVRAAEPVLHYRVLGDRSEVEHYRRYRQSEIDYGSLMLLADRVRREVPPDGTVLMWGSENALSYLSERRQPTRFHHYVALTYAKPPLPMAERWSRWFSEDLERNRPAMCVVNVRAFALSKRRGAESHRILARFLEGYAKVDRIDEIEVYVRRDLHRPAVE